MYGVLAGFHYLGSRRVDDTPRVPVAIAAFALQHILVLAVTALGGYKPLPTILMFLITMALLTALRLGLQAHNKAGFRIAMAAGFTLSAYACKISSDYYQFAKFYRS